MTSAQQAAFQAGIRGSLFDPAGGDRGGDGGACLHLGRVGGAFDATFGSRGGRVVV